MNLVVRALVEMRPQMVAVRNAKHAATEVMTVDASREFHHVGCDPCVRNGLLDPGFETGVCTLPLVRWDEEDGVADLPAGVQGVSELLYDPATFCSSQCKLSPWNSPQKFQNQA